MSADPTLCALCPRLCRFACPTAATDEAATPTSMAQALAAARRGELAWADAADVLGRCTGCMACAVPCELDQDVPAWLYAGRAEAWRNGGVAAGAQALHREHLRSGDPFGADLRALLHAHADADADFDRKGRVLFWPGCRALVDRAEAVAGLMRVFRALGAEHVSLPAGQEILCCGGALRAVGDEAGFQVAIAAHHTRFNRQRTLVTPSGECLSAIREGYPSTGNAVHAEVLHLAEYLAFFTPQLADLGRAAMERLERRDEPVPTVLVFDSCQVRRRGGRGEAVYGVLEALTGRRPASFAPSADRTVCCGAGDFHDLRRGAAAAELARASAAQRNEPLPARALVVATDPACDGALRSALGGVEVLDLMAFVVRWLGPVVVEGVRPRVPAPSGLKAP